MHVCAYVGESENRLENMHKNLTCDVIVAPKWENV